MKEQRARQILEALVHGVDPLTGQELAPATVLQHADVLRALLAGVCALEQMAARAQRRAQLPGNVGRAWTAGGGGTLVAAVKSGGFLAGIAARHRRTGGGIRGRPGKAGPVPGG